MFRSEIHQNKLMNNSWAFRLYFFKKTLILFGWLVGGRAAELEIQCKIDLFQIDWKYLCPESFNDLNETKTVWFTHESGDVYKI